MTRVKIDPPRETITPQQYRDAYLSYNWFAQNTKTQLENDHPHYAFDLNDVITLNVSIATYDDIDRYKAYHLRNARPDGTARADCVKRASYFAKWTSKLRPISFRPIGSPKEHKDDMALMSNETLAIGYALELIGSEFKRKIRCTDKFLRDLLYDLHYRDMNDAALLSIFQMIRDLAADGKSTALVEVSVI